MWGADSEQKENMLIVNGWRTNCVQSVIKEEYVHLVHTCSWSKTKNFYRQLLQSPEIFKPIADDMCGEPHFVMCPSCWEDTKNRTVKLKECEKEKKVQSFWVKTIHMFRK